METILLFAPLVGALIAGFGHGVIGDKAAQFLTTALLFLSALLSWVLFLSFDGQTESIHILRWIESGTLSTDWAIRMDRLTTIMLIVITTVSALVHLYSMGYMAYADHFRDGESYRPRFFAYLSFFTFAMLMLVTSDNLLQLFFGWEGVGVASYLLIGFYIRKQSAGAAAIKAFVVNRVGDFGFLLGIFGLYLVADSIKFEDIFLIGPQLATMELHFLWRDWNAANLIAFLLFVGAMGKSAQLILHTWLPDAMAGPTPVSALIHAATMVSAGIFMITRLNFLFDMAPSVQNIIAIVGAVTALVAATIALVQNDIKKVLAYSTVSQLGFMFLAIGSGAYVAAIFHMITHAFFKALLFLGSGSVIHGMHHEQDMRRMGALRKVMPVTGFTFIIGWLAIAGVPPFAGFWSKDEILLYVYANNRGLYVVGLVTALLTAYYMTRQVIMVFYGKARWNDNSAEHGAHGEITPHESPRVMLIPLIVLSVLSILGGAMQLPFSKDLHFLEHWLAPVVEESEAYIGKSWAYQNKYLLLLVAIVVAVSGILISISVYAKSKFKVIEPKILEQAWKYDHAVSRVVGGPGAATFNLIAWIDANIVDGIVNGVGELIRSVAGSVRRVQSGFVRTYALLISFGAVAILAWFLLRGVLL